MSTFRIATFVNDRALYEGMRSTFEAAGFREPLARYTIEQGEPYAAITRLGQSKEPYVLLVHQDVRCDLCDTADALQRRLAELTALDPTWAIAGNAGADPKHMLFLHLDDPNGRWRTHSGLPVSVVSLDENFLVLRTERLPRCSPNLSGFHLYGSDACLNARRDGSRAYVIQFLVTHLSGGNHAGLLPSRLAFAAEWSRHVIRPQYLRVSWGVIALARPRLLRRALQRREVVDRLVDNRFGSEYVSAPPSLSTQRTVL